MTPSELLKAFNGPIVPTGVNDGFVRLVDAMGDDTAIASAARVSYGDGTVKTSTDRGLIRYLVSHQHTSPLEMCEIKLHCKMPIMVARQWVRHRTANLNEVSGRFSVLPDEMYMPLPSSVAAQSTTNKQGRELAAVKDPAYAERFIALSQEAQRKCREVYEILVGEGYARELARINLPVSQYTEWYWKIDLKNLLHFLNLRLDTHAQFEIRVYAEVISEIVKAWVPYTWEAFADYVLNAVSLSAPEQEVIRYLNGFSDPNGVVKINHRLNKREVAELLNKVTALGFDFEVWRSALVRGVVEP